MSRAARGHTVSTATRSDDVKSDAARHSLDELNSVSLEEIVDQDSRPTFILDLDRHYANSVARKDELHPIFCNSALRSHHQLLDSVTGVSIEQSLKPSDGTTYQEFRSWATGASQFDDSRDAFPLTLIYCGMLWTGSTIQQRWRLISGNQCYQVSSISKGDPLSTSPSQEAAGELISPRAVARKKLDPPIKGTTSLQARRASTPKMASKLQSTGTSQHPDLMLARSKRSGADSSDPFRVKISIGLEAPEDSVPDWTVPRPAGLLSPHLQLARSIDWASTPLGPMTSWSPEFREIANLVMSHPFPAALFWGEDLTMLYNEAYQIEVAGNKHPALMGTGVSGPFAELWEYIEPVFRECARTGKGVRRENDCLPIERYGYLEETFLSWSVTPLYGGPGRILGFYNAPIETTYQTISIRRMQMLYQLGEKLAPARAVKYFWKGVLQGLELNPFDVPFALLYSVTDSDDGDTASHSSGSTISLKSCLLEGSIGVPAGHPAAPPRLDLKSSSEGFIPSFRQAMRIREPTTLQTRDGTFPEVLLDGIQWRGFGEPCREAVVIPVRPTNGENVFAFLLIGVNPRRAYDESYKTFVTMLNRQLATSLASILLFEDEARRSRNAVEAAALQREHFTQQLELQKSRLRRMTELSPLGMYLFSPDGVLVEGNDRYYEMTGHPKDSSYELSFLDHIAEGSQQAVTEMWQNIITEHKPRTAELQINNPKMQPRDLNGEPIEFWVLASSMPEIGMDGELRSVMGSIADISHMKWVQGLQEQRLREAEITKRQQNEFIDITSHEMRNPLSAILICADDIRDSLSEHTFSEKDATTIKECIEAANTIALCVQHQQCIIGDILTISKLDSNLLLITPVPVQPVVVIKRAMSMFRPEIQAKEIDFDFILHPSMQELDVDWVNLDPSRLLQITVNLITNAIKFTQFSQKRVISVHAGASTELPVPQTQDFQYVPTRNAPINVAARDEWGSGEIIYLRVKVEDTGCGLTTEEMQSLFERFAQASPRTHAHYGGSGLGLFISRQLAELHGGQVGVASQAGVGSTFGFFIQARRVPAPLATEKLTPAPAGKGPSPQGRPSEVEPSHKQLSAVAISDMSAVHPKQTFRFDPSQLHILLVEDNLVNQKVLLKQLQKVGCTVSTADNGVYALEYLETTEFQQVGGVQLSIILMDLEMPVMDGISAIGHIRRMEADGVILRHVPVIAVTANVRGEQVAAAKESGMDEVVSKPFRIPELLKKIELLLDKLASG